MVEPILSESPKNNPFHWGSKPTAQKKAINYQITPQKSNDSSPFLENHHLGYPAVIFRGCTAYTIFYLLSHSRRCLISSGQISSRPHLPPFSGKIQRFALPGKNCAACVSLECQTSRLSSHKFRGGRRASLRWEGWLCIDQHQEQHQELVLTRCMPPNRPSQPRRICKQAHLLDSRRCDCQRGSEEQQTGRHHLCRSDRKHGSCATSFQG